MWDIQVEMVEGRRDFVYIHHPVYSRGMALKMIAAIVGN